MNQRNIYIIILISFITAIIFPTTAVYACEIVGTPNWRYNHSYSFDFSDLPEGISISAIYHDPHYYGDYPIGLIQFNVENDESFQIIIQNEHGSLSSENANLKTGDVIVGDDISQLGLPITMGHFYDHSFYIEKILPIEQTNNTNEPALINPEIPEPTHHQIILVQDNKAIIVPFTIEYTINEAYIPNFLSGPHVPEHMEKIADTIVVATPLSSLNVIEDGYVYGQATFQVEKYLKGEGEALIQTGPFGNGADCNNPVTLDKPNILFLNEIEGNYYMLRVSGQGNTAITYSEEIEQTIRRIVDQEPYIPEPAIEEQETGNQNSEETNQGDDFVVGLFEEEEEHARENQNSENLLSSINFSRLSWIALGLGVLSLLGVSIFYLFNNQR